MLNGDGRFGGVFCCIAVEVSFSGNASRVSTEHLLLFCIVCPQFAFRSAESSEQELRNIMLKTCGPFIHGSTLARAAASFHRVEGVPFGGGFIHQACRMCSFLKTGFVTILPTKNLLFFEQNEGLLKSEMRPQCQCFEVRLCRGLFL